jgi:ABC-type transport system involved in multi-copper enzyme maturation permease subunit
MVRANMSFYLHTRRFKVILPIYIIVAFIFPVLYLTKVYQPPDVYSYTSSALAELVSLTVLLVALLAGDAISQDFGRQGFFTLTQPVRRSEIMLARTLAAFIFSAVAMMVWIGIGFITSFAFYATVIPNMALYIALAVLFVASVISFVVLFSSLLRSPTTSVVLSVLVVWFLMPIITEVFDLVGIEPWFLLTYAGEGLGDLTQASYPVHFTSTPINTGTSGVSITLNSYVPYVWETAAIMAGYFLVSLVLAWIVYSRKELTEAS